MKLLNYFIVSLSLKHYLSNFNIFSILPMVPLEFLQESKNKNVKVHTTNKNCYIGKLVNFDTYVNIVLSNAKMCDFETCVETALGNTIIQGNLVTFIEVL